MRTIPLTQGKVALVDNSDYEWLNSWKWYARKGRHTFYATHKIGIDNSKRNTELMHRLILGLQLGDKQQCDHRDGNGLNNQQANLRICTAMQNVQFSRKWKSATSRYKGVHWHRNACKWSSQICLNGRHIYVGLFDLEIDAARAYDAAALRHHKEFALTNRMLGLLTVGGS